MNPIRRSLSLLALAGASLGMCQLAAAQEAGKQNIQPATAGVAHRLKSASRSVGALQLGELCAELEDHCRKGGPPRPAEMVARFAAALRAALEASAAAGMEGNSS